MRARRLAVCLLFSPLLGACAAAPPGPAKFVWEPCPEAPPGQDGAAVVDGFYSAFARRDFRGMACSYDPNIEFTDSIFGTLHGKRALAMWAMLTSGATDLVVRHSNVSASGDGGRAHWDASYTFTFLAWHNHVDNHIDATFVLRSGKIVKHQDVFDLPKWMSMALSPLDGVVSESTLKDSVQSKLDDFIEKHPEFQDAPSAPR